MNDELFTEITDRQATLINGGLTNAQLLGSLLGSIGANWWSTNFRRALSTGNIGGAISVTDRYVRGLTNSLRRFGIAVPRYPF